MVVLFECCWNGNDNSGGPSHREVTTTVKRSELEIFFCVRLEIVRSRIKKLDGRDQCKRVLSCLSY